MFNLNMSMPRLFAVRWNLLCIALLIALSLLDLPAHARADEVNEENGDRPEFRLLKDSNKKIENPKCKIEANDALYSIMDKVCELCHDMYSHQNPNMMSQCRAKCYRSAHFKKCLHLFSPTRSLRHVLRRH